MTIVPRILLDAHAGVTSGTRSTTMAGTKKRPSSPVFGDVRENGRLEPLT